MPATQVNQKAVVTPHSTTNTSKNNAPKSAEDFAAVLANSLTPKGGKAVVTTQNSPLSIDPKSPKGLADVAALPLDFQGKEVDDAKNAKLATLSDILASVSHESVAPEGTSVLNLKNVLAYNNDDPELINTDLIALLPKKEQKAATNALIKGAKSVLHDRLLGLIPKDRIPKTLKGMVETAIRFSIPISDIKLESLPKSKISAKILTAFDTKSKRSDKSIPVTKSTVIIPTANTLKPSGKEDKLAEKSASPLEQLLNKNPKKSSEKGKTDVQASQNDTKLPQSENALKEGQKMMPKEIQTAQVATQSPQAEQLKAKIKNTETTKSEELKLSKEQSAKEAAQVAMKELQNVQAVAKQIQTKHSPLEQLLTDEKEKTEQNAIEHKNSAHQTAKAETMQKTEQVEGKIAEGRQMMRYLSNEIKEAINDYKPPFVKLSVKLNPARLGEIDVSIVKRGDKVHVNLSSNTAALNLLQNQSNDLKVALNNAGLNDASMNFSHSNQGSKEQQQQQQQQNNQHSTAKYQEMASLDEDTVDSLELIIPQYG